MGLFSCEWGAFIWEQYCGMTGPHLRLYGPLYWTATYPKNSVIMNSPCTGSKESGATHQVVLPRSVKNTVLALSCIHPTPYLG